MPTDSFGVNITGRNKSKRNTMLRRVRGMSDTDPGVACISDMEAESSLPPPLRSRLYDLFREIEREFETLYADHVTLQERFNEQGAGIEKLDGPDVPDGAQAWKQTVKKSGSQLSQRLKLTYKTSTSKLVSSFRTAASGCHFVREYRGHRDGVWEVSASHTDGHIIGTASADKTARLWWQETGMCLLQYHGHNGSVNSIRFHPTQDTVATSSGDQTTHIWKATVNIPSVDGAKCHSSGEDELEGSEKEDIDGYDNNDDKHDLSALRQPLRELRGHKNVVIAADWIHNGSQIVTASWDRTAIRFDVETGKVDTVLTGHEQELSDVRTHPTQQLAVTSSRDTTVRLWDFRDPSLKLNVFQGHTQQVTSAVFAGPDKIVSSSDDRTVKVWDLKNMVSPITTIRTDSAVNKIAVSPNHNMIAIPHDNRHIRLFDLQGVRLGRLPRNNRQGHSKMVCCTAWSEHEGSRCSLFSCGFDRHVYGWAVNLIKE